MANKVLIFPLFSLLFLKVHYRKAKIRQKKVQIPLKEIKILVLLWCCTIYHENIVLAAYQAKVDIVICFLWKL